MFIRATKMYGMVAVTLLAFISLGSVPGSAKWLLCWYYHYWRQAAVLSLLLVESGELALIGWL